MSEDESGYPVRIDLTRVIKPILTGETAWENDGIRMYVPEKPLIPPKEGTHIRIVLKESSPSPKTILRLWKSGLGLAKVLVEGRSTNNIAVSKQNVRFDT